MTFDALPDLPQVKALRTFCGRLWRVEGIVAIWLGGSFASGKADRYSDVDLRVAIAGEQISSWDSQRFVNEMPMPVLVEQTHFQDERAALYHFLLENCELYDIWLQTPDHDLLEEPRIVLGCRDNGLQDRLKQSAREARLDFSPVDGAELRGALVNYWLNHVKNQKVVHRNLTILWRDGLYLFGGLLLRLRFILATGQDCGGVTFPPMTIHKVTPVARILQEHYGEQALAGLEGGASSRADVIASIDNLSAEISRLGREAASRFGFDYPEALEARVLESWSLFKQQADM